MPAIWPCHVRSPGGRRSCSTMATPTYITSNTLIMIFIGLKIFFFLRLTASCSFTGAVHHNTLLIVPASTVLFFPVPRWTQGKTWFTGGTMYMPSSSYAASVAEPGMHDETNLVR